jgi:hypothetical protein
MFEDAFATAVYVLVLFFGFAFALILLTGFYWSRQMRSIYLNKNAQKKNGHKDSS